MTAEQLIEWVNQQTEEFIRQRYKGKGKWIGGYLGGEGRGKSLRKKMSCKRHI